MTQKILPKLTTRQLQSIEGRTGVSRLALLAIYAQMPCHGAKHALVTKAAKKLCLPLPPPHAGSEIEIEVSA